MKKYNLHDIKVLTTPEKITIVASKYIQAKKGKTKRKREKKLSKHKKEKTHSCSEI